MFSLQILEKMVLVIVCFVFFVLGGIATKVYISRQNDGCICSHVKTYYIPNHNESNPDY